MKVQDWENQFDEVSLARGKKIYREKKVEGIKADDEKITASVGGLKRYDVTISMKDGNLTRMKCQCPKSKSGSKCEHMAAVLYSVYKTEEEIKREAEKEAQKKALREKAAREAIRKQEAEEKERAEAEKARIEVEKRIAQRAAEKAEKRAERKRRRREAEEAAKAAALELEKQRAAEEARRLKAEEEKRREEAKKKRQEEEERQREEEERRRKKERRIQEAAARSKEDEDQYSYYDMDLIRDQLSLKAEHRREGKQIWNEHRIQIESIGTGYVDSENDQVVEVRAKGEEYGGRRFDMYLLFSRTQVLNKSCRCRECQGSYYWYNHNGCSYMAALANELEIRLREDRIGDATDKTGAELMSIFRGRHENQVIATTKQAEESLELVPRLIETEDKLRLSFKIGSGKLYVVKNLFELCQSVEKSETTVYGNSTEISHQLEKFTDRGREWYAYVHKVVQEELQMQEHMGDDGWYYESKDISRGAVELYGWRLDQFFELLGADGIDYEKRGEKGAKKIKAVLHTKEKNPAIDLYIRKTRIARGKAFHGIDVTCKMPVTYSGTETIYFIENDELCRADRDYAGRTKLLTERMYRGELKFQVGRNNLSEFYYMLLPQFEDVVNVMEENPDEIHRYLPPEFSFIFYLDADRNNITCRVHVKYGDREFSVFDILDDNGMRMYERYRIKNKEAEVFYLARQIFPYIDIANDVLHCAEDEAAIFMALDHGVETLMNLGEVQCTKSFKNLYTIRSVKVTVGVSVSGGMLNLNVGTDLPPQELLEILKSYRQKKKYYRVKDGDFFRLEDDTLGVIEEIAAALRLSPKELASGNIKLPSYRTLYLDKLLEENETIYSTRDSRFRNMVKQFKTVHDADYEIPDSLAGIMREYQKNGYRWVRTLASCGFGGILADDMGLGKTLQAIAVLLAEKEEGSQQTALVVAPASLVYNWGEEFAKFAPQMKVLLITGNQEERRGKLEEYRSYDVLVTSYDLLKRDIESYENKHFRYQIIDEAQYIKNHLTAAAKAVKIIKSEIRIAMTGTPIENRLSELWSIFDYLMPGFLYGYDVFRRELEQPIVKNQDETAMLRLKKLVGPFILRRMKEDVLRDLPEKLEETRFVKIEEEQRTLYDAQVVHMKTMIGQQKDEEFNKNKFRIFAELTKLRQICCDPSLCFENYGGESAKLESCLELIQSAIDGGHKILLFSQFTSMLDILAKRLEEQDISFYVITGTTAKDKRLQMVKAFNEDDTPLFLISLKAGGVGLNLTGADVVIHYDPWWNLAVQNQATDRAHRIGQRKKVIVYRMIAKESIEEKILQLQEKKKDLADQIVNAENGQFGNLSKEELLELLEV